ncbi:MAG: DNA glycosylase AlkZ-like family protein [Actinomycetota bacterium]
MELTERLRAWTSRRMRLEEPAGTPEQALRAVVAVYSTHPTSPLALRARCRSFSRTRYSNLDRRHKAIRIPAMRHTVFLIPTDHAARVFTATRPSIAHALRPLKRIGFSNVDYERSARRILTAASEPITARDLGDLAGLKGAELTTVLRCLRYEGRLLTLAGESLNSSPHLYVSMASWLPEGLDAGDANDALAWLAGEYLRAYGPARAADFAWWAGVGRRAATTATARRPMIDLGDGLLLPTNDERPFTKVTALGNTVAILPKWDAYTMGYAPDGRARFVHPDVQERVYTPMGTGLPGDGNPVVLVGGEVVATWTFTQKIGASVQPFDSLGARTRRRVEEKLDEVAHLLG